MELVIVVLKKEEYIDEVVEALVEAEIKGISIVDGVEIEKILAVDIPIFAGLVKSMSGFRGTNKVILGVTEKSTNIDEFLSILKEFREDENLARYVEIISVPVSRYVTGELDWGLL